MTLLPPGETEAEHRCGLCGNFECPCEANARAEKNHYQRILEQQRAECEADGCDAVGIPCMALDIAFSDYMIARRELEFFTGERS